ncbi:MAG: glycosyltransferase [Candidatus Cyclobacteriaceae bacterium M3_2C_046]
MYTLFYAFLMWILNRAWVKIPIFKTALESKPLKVSVVVAARNEEDNILRLLKDLEKQTYPHQDFEVIVIDDQSEDQTYLIAEQFSRSSSMKLIRQKIRLAPEFTGSTKKKAISQAVGLASGEIILATDADCRVPADWVKQIVACWQQFQPNMIIGPVAFSRQDTLLDQMQILEFTSLIGTGAATLQLGHPTMCNGANLAFSKKIFEQVRGYQGLDHIISGDDEFLLQKIHALAPAKVHFIKNIDAQVYTEPQPNLQALIHQRRRWAGKWKHQQRPAVMGLALFVFFYQFSFLTVTLLMISQKYPILAYLLQLAVKILVEFVFLKNIHHFSRIKFRKRIFIIWQLFYPVYAVFFGIIANLGIYRWKGRTYKI